MLQNHTTTRTTHDIDSFVLRLPYWKHSSKTNNDKEHVKHGGRGPRNFAHCALHSHMATMQLPVSSRAYTAAAAAHASPTTTSPCNISTSTNYLSNKAQPSTSKCLPPNERWRHVCQQDVIAAKESTRMMILPVRRLLSPPSFFGLVVVCQYNTRRALV